MITKSYIKVFTTYRTHDISVLHVYVIHKLSILYQVLYYRKSELKRKWLSVCRKRTSYVGWDHGRTDNHLYAPLQLQPQTQHLLWRQTKGTRNRGNPGWAKNVQELHFRNLMWYLSLLHGSINVQQLPCILCKCLYLWFKIASKRPVSLKCYTEYDPIYQKLCKLIFGRLN